MSAHNAAQISKIESTATGDLATAVSVFRAQAETRGSDLASALKAYRTKTAQQISQPAYCIFSNKVLDEIVTTRPTTSEALLRVPGFGQQKLQKFGAEILRIVSGAPAPALPLAGVVGEVVLHRSAAVETS